MEWILQNGEKAGIIGHLAFDILAFLRSWIVPGTLYEKQLSENALLRDALNESNKRDRDRLDRAEDRLNAALAPRGR